MCLNRVDTLQIEKEIKCKKEEEEAWEQRNKEK
jgi:hypothetical protein